MQFDSQEEGHKQHTLFCSCQDRWKSGNFRQVSVEFRCRLSSGIRRRVAIFNQGTVLALQSEKGMAKGSDSLKERVTRIENFLGIVGGYKTECVVT